MTSSPRPPLSSTARWIIGLSAAVIIAGVMVTWWAIATQNRAAGDAPASGASAVTSAPVEPGPPAPSDELPADTGMGAVTIAARDLDTLTEYYRDVIGLTVIEESAGIAVLGIDEPLIRLEATDAGADDPRSAGLYHSAILFDDAASLARTLVNVAELAPESYQGSSDHAVSLAFYVGDPEGNGVELYIDRPRDEWLWEDGEVVMGSAMLDPNQFIDENLGDEASGSATMGHVHLRVGDLDQARAFYSDVLGFDVTSEAQGAVFYSAGGYHHHLATNTWQSAGAGQRAESAGLRGITVAVPAASDLDALVTRLADAGIEHSASDSHVVTADPWGNAVRFVLS
ncbi:VOC family protein [Microbacterium abyssi]|uniref:VOC family protein n=1 Tax=Microbacterium abyssi TaxID=2782166 RepID=UPI001E65A1C7|nr:VOC family protein [Microbacterium sp. A18JL241]